MRDVILSFPRGPVRLLTAGAERIRRSQARGLPGDDPELPVRWLKVTRDGQTFSVAVGPVDYGWADRELWETLLEIH
jgi:hypothetical protein